MFGCSLLISLILSAGQIQVILAESDYNRWPPTPEFPDRFYKPRPFNDDDPNRPADPSYWDITQCPVPAIPKDHCRLEIAWEWYSFKRYVEGVSQDFIAVNMYDHNTMFDWLGTTEVKRSDVAKIGINLTPKQEINPGYFTTDYGLFRECKPDCTFVTERGDTFRITPQHNNDPTGKHEGKPYVHVFGDNWNVSTILEAHLATRQSPYEHHGPDDKYYPVPPYWDCATTDSRAGSEAREFGGGEDHKRWGEWFVKHFSVAIPCKSA